MDEPTDGPLDLDVLEAEDIMIENTITDFIDSTNRLKHDLAVAYVKYCYLRHITNEFQKEGSIGKGGFSEVFKGVTRQSKTPLAIKKLYSNSDEERKIMSFEGNKYHSYINM